MATVTIYHNPRCTKSRQTLSLLQDKGVDVEVIEYLKTPPTEKELARIVDMLDVSPDQLIRRGDLRKLELSLPDHDDEIIRLMVANPAIIERPIVVCGKRAVLGRPPENALQIV